MSALAHSQPAGMPGARTGEAETPVSGRSPRFRVLACGRIGYTRLASALDEDATSSFRRQAQRLLDGGCRALILDLSAAPFVDSHGLRALLLLRDEAEQRRVWLRGVVSPGSPVERTLRLLGFDSLFSLFASPAAAWRRRLPRDARRD